MDERATDLDCTFMLPSSKVVLSPGAHMTPVHLQVAYESATPTRYHLGQTLTSQIDNTDGMEERNSGSRLVVVPMRILDWTVWQAVRA